MAPASPSGRPAHILLIDDDASHVELAQCAFQALGTPCVLHVATGGEQGLGYLLGTGPFADRQAHPLPQLVLLDLKMPRVDGHEVLRVAKQDENVRCIPVIVLSSSMEDEDVRRAYTHGANSFLRKPITFERQLAMLRAVQAYWLEWSVLPRP